MSYSIDEYELEMSHERERRFERDLEREPRLRARRSWKRPRYLPIAIAANANATMSAEREAA
jgi:hypothetical protein